MSRFALQISLSIGAIILAVALCALLEGLGVQELAFGALLIAVVAVSVTVMVAGGIQYDNFCKRHPVIPDFYAAEERYAFHDRFVWYIAGSIGAIILAVALCAWPLSSCRSGSPTRPCGGGPPSGGGGFGDGDGLGGDNGGKIQNREVQPHQPAGALPHGGGEKRDDRIERACGVIMVLTAAAYVTMGLTMDLWKTAWWVFPVGFILCGVVHVAFGPREED